jgi:hypothetical protein
LHGDIPVSRLDRKQIKEFDKVLRGLPARGPARIMGLPILEAIEKGREAGLKTLAYKARKKYIDLMKAMTKNALDGDGSLQADPFSGYNALKEKRSTAKLKRMM